MVCYPLLPIKTCFHLLPLPVYFSSHSQIFFLCTFQATSFRILNLIGSQHISTVIVSELSRPSLEMSEQYIWSLMKPVNWCLQYLTRGGGNPKESAHRLYEFLLRKSLRRSLVWYFFNCKTWKAVRFKSFAYMVSFSLSESRYTCCWSTVHSDVPFFLSMFRCLRRQQQRTCRVIKASALRNSFCGQNKATLVWTKCFDW